jgi:hypothetical protein
MIPQVRNGDGRKVEATIVDAYGRPVRSERDFALRQVLTFDSLIYGGNHTYYHGIWDESRRHSIEDSLAMDRDVHFMRCLWERFREVTSLKFHLEVDDENDPWQSMVRDGITQALNHSHRLRRLFTAHLWAIWWGRAGAQVKWRWGRAEVDGPKGKTECRVLELADHLPVQGMKIGHTWNHVPYVQVYGATENSDLAGGDAQYGYTTESKALFLTGGWRERILLHQYNAHDCDFREPDQSEAIHGLGLKSYLYWECFWLKNEYLTSVIKALDRFGLGFVSVTYPSGNDKAKQEALDAAQSVGVNRSVLVVPRVGDSDQGGVEIHETPVSGVQVMRDMVSVLDDKAERFIIAQTGSSSSKTSGMGTHDPTFMMETKARMTEEDAHELGETTTGSEQEPGLIHVIKKHSFPWADFPVRLVFDFRPPDVERKLGAITLGYNIGVDYKKDQVREIVGLSKPAPGDEVLQNPQFQQQPGQQPPPGGEDGQGGQPAPVPPQDQPPGSGGGEGDPVFDKILRTATGGVQYAKQQGGGQPIETQPTEPPAAPKPPGAPKAVAQPKAAAVAPAPAAQPKAQQPQAAPPPPLSGPPPAVHPWQTHPPAVAQGAGGQPLSASASLALDFFKKLKTGQVAFPSDVALLQKGKAEEAFKELAKAGHIIGDWQYGYSVSPYSQPHDHGAAILAHLAGADYQQQHLPHLMSKFGMGVDELEHEIGKLQAKGLAHYDPDSGFIAVTTKGLEHHQQGQQPAPLSPAAQKVYDVLKSGKAKFKYLFDDIKKHGGGLTSQEAANVLDELKQGNYVKDAGTEWVANPDVQPPPPTETVQQPSHAQQVVGALAGLHPDNKAAAEKAIDYLSKNPGWAFDEDTLATVMSKYQGAQVSPAKAGNILQKLKQLHYVKEKPDGTYVATPHQSAFPPPAQKPAAQQGDEEPVLEALVLTDEEAKAHAAQQILNHLAGLPKGSQHAFTADIAKATGLDPDQMHKAMYELESKQHAHVSGKAPSGDYGPYAVVSITGLGQKAAGLGAAKQFLVKELHDLGYQGEITATDLKYLQKKSGHTDQQIADAMKALQAEGKVSVGQDAQGKTVWKAAAPWQGADPAKAAKQLQKYLADKGYSEQSALKSLGGSPSSPFADEVMKFTGMGKGELFAALQHLNADTSAWKNAAQPSAPQQQKPAYDASHLPVYQGTLKSEGRLSGGHAGAELMRDEGGNLWVKKYGDSPGHAEEEVAADNLYRAGGASAPESAAYRDEQGRPYRLAKYVDGAKPLAVYMKELPAGTPPLTRERHEERRREVLEKLGKHFALDALLGNWDVVGPDYGNVVVDAEGNPQRIDNGGALRFRGMGESKQAFARGAWRKGVIEMETLRDPFINPQAARAFKHLSQSDLANQVKELVGRRAELLAASPQAVRGQLAERLDWLREHYVDNAGVVFAPHSIYSGKGGNWKDVPPDPNVSYTPAPHEENHPAFKEWQDGETRHALTGKAFPTSFHAHTKDVIDSLHPDDKQAVVRYTGKASSTLNEQMRDCPETLDCLDHPQRALAESIQRALAAAGKMAKPVTVWRGFGLGTNETARFDRVMRHALTSGDDVRLPGFKSSSYSPDAAFGGSIRLEIRTRSGLVVQSISQVPGEREVLLPHNARYRVTGIKQLDLDGDKRQVYQLEEL